MNQRQQNHNICTLLTEESFFHLSDGDKRKQPHLHSAAQNLCMNLHFLPDCLQVILAKRRELACHAGAL